MVFTDAYGSWMPPTKFGDSDTIMRTVSWPPLSAIVMVGLLVRSAPLLMTAQKPPLGGVRSSSCTGKNPLPPPAPPDVWACCACPTTQALNPAIVDAVGLVCIWSAFLARTRNSYERLHSSPVTATDNVVTQPESVLS